MKLDKKIFGISLLATVFLAACSGSSGDGSVDRSLLSLENSGRIAPVTETAYDWGDIDIRGGDVANVFKFRNEGDDDLIVKTASTSCMCTTADIKLSGGSESPQFGMHGRIDWGGIVKPGEEFEIDVVFDPMAHGPSATGPIQRSVYLVTSSVANGSYARIEPRSGQMLTEMKVSGNVLSSEDYERKKAEDSKPKFKNISAAELQESLSDKDFFLLDVHIPEQDHIEGTDQFVPYDKIAENLDKLPEDKNTPLVVYCRSGSMSVEASEKLIELGYSDVTNVLGGRNAYLELSE